MKDASAAYIAHIEGETTALRTAYRLTRRDGKQFFFTDNDVDYIIDPDGGNNPRVFLAGGGYTRSTIVNTSSLSVDNLDITSTTDPEFSIITERDVRAGLLDFAEVEMWSMVSTDNTIAMTPLKRGFLGEVSLRDDIYTAELRGLSQLLTHSIVEVHSPQCRQDVGDLKCKVAISPPLIDRTTILPLSFEVGGRFAVETLGHVAVPVVNEGFATADVTTGVTTISVGSTTTFTRTVGSFVDDGFLAGMNIETASFTDAANNGTFTVDTVAALTLTTVESTLVAETGDADEIITSFLFGWVINSGDPRAVTSSGSLDPQLGTHLLTGLTGSAVDYEVEQIIDMSSLLNLTTVDALGYVFDYGSYRAQGNTDLDDRGRILVEYLTAADALISVAYDSGDEAFNPGNTWNLRTLLGVNVPTLTRKIRVTLSGTIGAGTANNAAHDTITAAFRLETGGVDVPVVNPGFETGDLTGWTTNFGTPDVVASSGALVPQTGANFLTGGAAANDSYSIQQIIDMTGLLTLATIDAEGYVFEYTSYRAQGSSDTNDTGSVVVRFLDADNRPILQAYDTGVGVISPTNRWLVQQATGVPVPALTRKISVELTGDDVSGTTTNASHDNVTAKFRLVSEVTPTWESTENIIYKVITAGTTSPAQPNYDTTPGNPTTDGDAVLEAEEAFKRFATIEDVKNNNVFNIVVDEPRAIKGWFHYGVVKWETGENAQTPPMEVKDWKPSVTTGSATIGVTAPSSFTRTVGSFVDDGFEAGTTMDTLNFTDGADNGRYTIVSVADLTIVVEETSLVTETGTGNELMTSVDQVTLLFGMSFPITTADRITIYKGCNKSLVACQGFSNVNNMRAEIYMAGTTALVHQAPLTPPIGDVGGSLAIDQLT